MKKDLQKMVRTCLTRPLLGFPSSGSDFHLFSPLEFYIATADSARTEHGFSYERTINQRKAELTRRLHCYQIDEDGEESSAVILLEYSQKHRYIDMFYYPEFDTPKMRQILNTIENQVAEIYPDIKVNRMNTAYAPR